MMRENVFIVLACCSLLTTIGCGGSQPLSSDMDPHLVLLTKLYSDHLNAKQGAPPADRQAFEDFIRNHGEHRLKQSPTEDLEKLFVSTRDGQPLVMFYGKISDPWLQRSVVGHEQVGIDGKRCVGMRYGTVQLVDQKEFEQLVPSQ
jgi:hypothetical protein